MVYEADRLKLHKHKAAENTTILCSLLATCKAQESNPGTFIKYYKISQLIHTQIIAN